MGLNVKVGTRVISEGPNGIGGVSEGHVGTIQGHISKNTPKLQWDRGGPRMAYPLGGKCKLLVLDSGPAGIRHNGYTCEGCGDEDIGGCRWTCSQCKASSLCTRCYGDMVHDITHRFLRFDTSTSKGVEVPPRCSSVRIQSHGLYPNAVVKMIGDERQGKILTVGDHRYGLTVRSMVRIQWEDGETGIYRAGHEGEVDVRCVTEHPGMFYYRNHLQQVGTSAEETDGKTEQKISEGNCKSSCTPPSSTKSKSFTQRDPSSTKETGFTQRNPSSTKPKGFTHCHYYSKKSTLFTPGDRVCIKVALIEFGEMQRKEGIWNQKIAPYLREFGKVTHYTCKGHVAVSFDGDVMIICERALKKIPLLTEGDTVRISPNLDELVQLQSGHGGFVGEMRMSINKVGVVKKVKDDGCVEIAFGSSCWHFNPACCIPAPGAKVDDIAKPVPPPTHTTTSFKELYFDAMRGYNSSEDEDENKRKYYEDDDEVPVKLNGKIVKDSVLIGRTKFMFETFRSGAYNLTLQILRSDTRLKRVMYGRDILLAGAASSNNVPFVRQLLDEGLDINQLTQGENIPLTFAVISGNREMVKLFLERGCSVNNPGKADAPIEMAVKFGFSDIAMMLLEKDVEVNRLDPIGETTCHLCAALFRNEVLSVIFAKCKVDPFLLNENDYTFLHSATIKGNHRAVELIVEKFPNIVDYKMKKCEFTALHFAASDDRTDCIRVLVDKGKADINMKNIEGWTALHIACIKLNDSSIECLLKKGADVNAKDKKGQTALYYVMGGGLLADNVYQLWFNPYKRISDEQRIHLSCKLLQHGANPDIKNDHGKTALECAVNSTVKSAVTMFIRSRSETSTESIFNLPCANCIDARVDIKIRPCGHKFLCRVCISKVKLCPFCKVEIEGNEDLPNTAAPKTDQSCKLQ